MQCLLNRVCLLYGVSVKGGSTVYCYVTTPYKSLYKLLTGTNYVYMYGVVMNDPRRETSNRVHSIHNI